MLATVVGVEIGGEQIRVAVRVTEEGQSPVMLTVVMPQAATLAQVVAEGRRLLTLRSSLIGQVVEG